MDTHRILIKMDIDEHAHEHEHHEHPGKQQKKIQHLDFRLVPHANTDPT